MAQGWNLISIKIMLKRHLRAVHSLIVDVESYLRLLSYLEMDSWRLDHWPVSQQDWNHFVSSGLPPGPCHWSHQQGKRCREWPGTGGPAECQQCALLPLPCWNPQTSLPTEQRPHFADETMEVWRPGLGSEFLLLCSDRGEIQIQVPDELLLFYFFPTKPQVSLYMLACAFDYFGIYSRNSGQNHEGGAEGQGPAHPPQASFFPWLGLGFVSKYSSERGHFSWKMLVIWCM